MSLKPDDIELMLFLFRHFFVFFSTWPIPATRCNTSYKPKTLNPTWNEDFVLDVNSVEQVVPIQKTDKNMIINVFCALPWIKKKIWVIFQNCLFEGQPQSGCMGFQRWGISEWQVWENKSGGSDTFTMMEFFQGVYIFYQVKDGRGLRKFIKETLHATAGKINNIMVYSCQCNILS